MRRRGGECGDRHGRDGSARHVPPVPTIPTVPSGTRATRDPDRRHRSRLPSGRMTRFGIDAPTLLHLVADGVVVAPGHQLVAPQLLRSQALDLLYAAVR